MHFFPINQEQSKKSSTQKMTTFKLIDNKLTFEIQALNLIQKKQDEGHQIQ